MWRKLLSRGLELASQAKAEKVCVLWGTETRVRVHYQVSPSARASRTRAAHRSSNLWLRDEHPRVSG